MRVFNMMLARARGGVESMAVRYHEALAAEGHEVVSFGHPKGVLAEEIPAAVFRPMTARFDYDPLSVVQLRRALARFAPELVLTHGGRAAGLSFVAAGGARTVQVMHNQFFKTYTRRFRAGLCVSRSVLEAARSAYPALPLYETTNFTHLEVRPVKPAPSRVPVIGALGRLHEQKAFEVLLSALARLKAEGVAFNAAIAGDGPERAALETLRGRLSLDAEVAFLGWVSPVADFLAGLDLYVMSSHYEPFGLSLAEALAAGTPAIAAGIEGPAEILGHGRFGRMFENRDAAALAAALRAAMDDWPATLRMAEAGQAHALATYGFEAGRRRLSTALASISDD
jgi:glycosyltransferase involved in cell wall biosynthesis